LEPVFLKTLLVIVDREWTVFLASLLPVSELRGAIPLGFSLGMHPLENLLFSWLGSFLPALPVTLFMRIALEYLEDWPLSRKLSLWLRHRTQRKADRVRMYSIPGLFLLVAIPLPSTGVWTGSMVAAMLHLPLRQALITIAAGNLIAGLIVTVLTYSLL